MMKRRRNRFYAAIAISFLLVFAAGYYIINSVYNIVNLGERSFEINQIIINTNKATLSAKEFLINIDSDENFYKNGTTTHLESFKLLMNQLRQQAEWFDSPWAAEFHLSKNKATAVLFQYEKAFEEIQNRYKARGYKSFGLEGNMRNHIHKIETSGVKIDNIIMLMLRKHEKDFLLRKDLQYVELFKKELVRFEAHLKTLPVTPERDALIEELDGYELDFLGIVSLEKAIGLTTNEGLRAEMEKHHEMLEDMLMYVDSRVTKEKDEAFAGVGYVVLVLSLLFLFIVVTTLSGTFYFLKSIRRPLLQLTAAANRISRGNLSADLEGIRDNPLFAELVVSFEMIMTKFKYTMDTVKDILSRKVTDIVPLEGKNDEVGLTLNQIIYQMKEIDGLEARRKWVDSGITSFSVLIRETSDVTQFSKLIVTALVKYLDACQAGMYLVNSKGKETVIELKAAYAYGRNKFIEKQIFPGEGLVGQCYLEAETTLLTEIPDNYLYITSGLGEANPSCILLVPCLTNMGVEAVIELASFVRFEKHHIELVEKVGEMVANAIANIRINEETRLLLTETQLQATEMKLKEEELRQNLEELAATQEEMNRREEAYKEQIASLLK